MPMRYVGKPGGFRISHSNVLQGRDLHSVLLHLASDLDQGLPQGWERLIRDPDTNGTSDIEIINPQDLSRVIEPWGIDESIRDDVVEDIRALIQLPVGEGYYVAQHFTYALPHCHAGEKPVCLSTLFVVARPRVVYSDRVWTTELAHVYAQSSAESMDQLEYYECCHRCWLRRCCHPDCSRPRGLSPKELSEIQQVLSTNQAWWAYEHLPENVGLVETQPSTQRVWPVSVIDSVLRRFIHNKAENKEVFKEQDEGFLGAIQNDTRSRRQNIKKMMVSVNEQDVAPLLENMLSDCFKRAGAEESVADWFRRVYTDNHGEIISLECEVSSQRKEVVNPPTTGCNSSTSITSKATYSWVIISPRNTLLDCLLMSSKLEVNHLECVPETDFPGDIPDDHCKDDDRVTVAAEESKGSVVRWALGHPDGSFSPVHYLVQWDRYPTSVNKALLDILRYALAASYLEVGVPSLDASNNLQDGFKNTDVVLQMEDPAMAAFAASMKAFAEGWSAVAKALKTTITEDVKIKVCLGFDKYKHIARAAKVSGVDKANLPDFVEHIAKMAELPSNDDLEAIMLGVKFGEEAFTWISEAMSYTAPDGMNHFLYLTKHANPATNKTTVLYGMVNSKYKLAPDMLIVNRKMSIAGGIFESEKTIFRTIPHVMSLNDTVILEMYFEMVVFRQMAMVSNLLVPEYPDLSGLCDKSTN